MISHTDENLNPVEYTEVDQKVREAQIRLLFKQTWTGLAGVLFVAISLCVVSWHVLPRQKLILWISCLILITVSRCVLSIEFRRKNPDSTEIEQWARWHVISVAQLHVREDSQDVADHKRLKVIRERLDVDDDDLPRTEMLENIHRGTLAPLFRIAPEPLHENVVLCARSQQARELSPGLDRYHTWACLSPGCTLLAPGLQIIPQYGPRAGIGQSNIFSAGDHCSLGVVNVGEKEWKFFFSVFDWIVIVPAYLLGICSGPEARLCG